MHFYLEIIESEAKKWLEFIKDYDLNIQYYPRKANIVVDALSCKSISNACWSITQQPKLIKELNALQLEFNNLELLDLYVS